MGRRLCRRSTATVVAVFLLLSVVLAARCVDGSRSNRWPGMGSGGGRLFGGYELPRAKLIPPSGPSERHNSVGPESTVPEQQKQQLELRKP